MKIQPWRVVQILAVLLAGLSVALLEISVLTWHDLDTGRAESFSSKCLLSAGVLFVASIIGGILVAVIAWINDEFID